MESDDAGNRAIQRKGGFCGKGFVQDLHTAGSRSAVDDVDGRPWNARQFLVLPKQGRPGFEQTDIQTVITALAIQHGDQLIKARGTTGSGKGEAAGDTIKGVSVSDHDAQSGAVGNLFRDAQRGLLDQWGTAIRVQQNADADSFTGLGLAFLEPGTLQVERLTAGHAVHAKGDVVNDGNFEIIEKEPRKNILHAESDGQTVRNGDIARGIGVFYLYRSVAFEENLRGEAQRAAFAVNRVLGQS